MESNDIQILWLSMVCIHVYFVVFGKLSHIGFLFLFLFLVKAARGFSVLLSDYFVFMWEFRKI